MNINMQIGKPDTATIYESHLHEQFELYLVLSDNITVETESGLYSAKKGDVFIFAPFCFHKITADGAKFERYILSFDGDSILNHINCLEKFFFLYIRNKYTRYTLSEADTVYLSKLFDNAIELLKDKTANTLELCAMLLRTFALLTRNTPHEGTEKKNTHLISDILHYIGRNAANGITTQDICNEFSIGKTTLYDMFKTTLDTTPGEYLLKHRIKLAKGYLDSGMSVTEAANRSGFNSYSHFIRIFKQKTGYSPRAYSKVETKVFW